MERKQLIDLKLQRINQQQEIDRLKETIHRRDKTIKNQYYKIQKLKTEGQKEKIEELRNTITERDNTIKKKDKQLNKLKKQILDIFED